MSPKKNAIPSPYTFPANRQAAYLKLFVLFKTSLGGLFGELTHGMSMPLPNVVSLSRLEELRTNVGDRMLALLQNGEFNPVYYLLLRVYSDGMKLNVHIPPIAILHPYHSARIETQKAAFTIFPMAFQNGQVRPMESFDECRNCLFKIRLLNPSGIAQDMRLAGFSHTDIYPELFEHARTIMFR